MQVFPKTDPKRGMFRVLQQCTPAIHASNLTANNPGPAKTSTVPGSGSAADSNSAFGNPYLLQDVFGSLEHAFSSAIDALEDEERANGGAGKDPLLLQRVKAWRGELEEIVSGRKEAMETPGEQAGQEGGMFAD